MQSDVVTKIAGFDYSKGTAKGFQRQRTKGAVTPPIRTIQSTYKSVHSAYNKIISRMIKLFESHLDAKDFTTDAASPGFSLSFLQELNEVDEGLIRELAKRLNFQLADAQRHFFKEFVKSTDPRVVLRISYALEKDDVFGRRMDALRRLFLDSSIERIQGETDLLKRVFLKRFTDFITGQSTEFKDFSSIVEKMKQTTVHESKFFARDQFSKFNTALSIASYEEADVKYVKWLTVNDVRVRGKPGGKFPKALPSHWALHGKVFPIDKIPKEKYDYNCFIPETIIEGIFSACLKVDYSGPIREIETSRGRRLSVTPNHPILTDQGWVKANDLIEGMNTIGYSPDAEVNFSRPRNINNQNGPMRIKDIFDSFFSQGTGSMSRSLNFNGDTDFFKSDIHIVRPYRKLRQWVEILRNKRKNSPFYITDKTPIGIIILKILKTSICSFYFLLNSYFSSRCRVPRIFTLTLNKISIFLQNRPLDFFGFGLASHFNTKFGESSKKDRSQVPCFIAELFKTGSSKIEFDKIVNIRDYNFSGQVYDLQSRDGWIISNGIVSSNCRCTLIPVFKKEGS